ncbi:MAG: hypothetical protein ACTSQY_03045 [Candidatus Odinarchaeia archaeon]
MEAWEKFLSNIVKPPILEIHREKGRQIKEILTRLDSYNYDYVSKWRTININEDIIRQDFIGSVQAFIVGSYDASILYSCFSVETALLDKLDKILSPKEKERKKFIQFNEIITLSKKKGIIDNKIKKDITKIQKIRNTQVHRANFLSGLLTAYKTYNKMFFDKGIEKKDLEDGLNILADKMPKELYEFIVTKYPLNEVYNAYENIEKMSDYIWASNPKLVNEMKKEVEITINEFISKFTTFDFSNFKEYFNDILLYRRSLSTLTTTYRILIAIDFL